MGKPDNGGVELVAQKLFEIQHPGIEWGHSGTADDYSWRMFEQKCLLDAQTIITILKQQAGYVQIRKGDLYFSREQLSCPDPAKEFYGGEE